MTIKSSGSLSMQEINAEFGLGTNLGAYRGVQWWTDSYDSGNFQNTSTSFEEFYSKRKNPAFAYESVGVGFNSSGTATATAGITGSAWKTPVPLAFIGFGGSVSSDSETYSNFTWDGTNSDWHTGIVDNGDSEHYGGSIALKNIVPGDADTSKTMQMIMTSAVAGGFFYSYIRLIGGSVGKTWSNVTSDSRSGAGYPYTYNLPSLQVGDVVVLNMGFRSSSSTLNNSTATNMTKVVALNGETSRSQDIFIKIIDTPGSFSTTISAAVSQQWIDLISVFRQT